MRVCDRMTDQTASPSSPRYRAVVLAMLLLVYTFNFLDRQILGILAVPIKADLGLSDTQLGALGGIAFALLYSTLAIPLALLADRTSRTWVITVSLAVWSGFTALCGLASSFLQLFLFRIGVGVGEAGGVAPSYAVISDYFPPHQRARAPTIYSLGLPLGSAVGLAVEEATGTTLGPGGYGWWLTLAGGGLLLTLLWAILPMQERLPTAVSIGSGLLAWCCAVVCAWQGASTQWLATIGPAAWTWGAALILIGMLIAGRSTVREIRGQTRRRQRPARQPQRRTVTPGQHPQHARSHTAADVAGADTGPDFEVAGSDGDPAPPWEADREAIDSSAESADGDDGPVDDEEDPQESAHRKLSKAERRRLRKLARSGRAA